MSPCVSTKARRDTKVSQPGYLLLTLAELAGEGGEGVLQMGKLKALLWVALESEAGKGAVSDTLTLVTVGASSLDPEFDL